MRTVGLVAAGFLFLGLLASFSLGGGADTGRAATGGTPEAEETQGAATA
jgi:hypothetical protein